MDGKYTQTLWCMQQCSTFLASLLPPPPPAQRPLCCSG